MNLPPILTPLSSAERDEVRTRARLAFEMQQNDERDPIHVASRLLVMLERVERRERALVRAVLVTDEHAPPTEELEAFIDRMITQVDRELAQP